MKKIYAIILLSIGLITYKSAKAQDPEFTQFYANPLYLNPALAGSNICPRVCLNYRNQWPAISGTYVTTSASIDRYVFGIKSGIGFLVTNDNAGQGTLKTTNISAIYSKQIQINRNFSINAGLQATYGQKSIDWSKLTFGDMVDERRGFVYNTEETQHLSKRSFVDFSAGAVAFSKYVFIGFAAHHLTQPDEGLLGTSKLPVKFTGHAGATIPIGPKSNETSISPNILYQQQQDFQQLNLGVYVTKGALVGGFWYRNNDAIIVLIGVQHGVFKVGYSYDVTVSKLTNASAGSHEISIGMNFFCKKPKPKYRPSTCPSF
ncbi:MAG: type IX secretion system membrane protein PorP/SprF [Bacteroidetes bacterium]|nr:type IX secretion system membrane protein PorP/SprF [Bacteroidota bacterium]